MTDDYILKEKHKQYLKEFKYKQNKGAYRKKDSEKQKTYNAEHVYYKTMGTKYNSTEKELKDLHKRIVNSKTWFNNSVIKYKPKLEFSNKLGGAYASKYSIRIGGMMCKEVLIHELAHSIGNLHHGRSFRQSQVMLTGRFLGAEHKKALMKAYKEAGLSYGKARKPKSYEQWVKSYRHMQKIKDKFFKS